MTVSSSSHSDPTRDDEFVELLTEHQSQLMGYIYALVQNLSDAEDLFQQTSLVLWEKFDDYEPGSEFVRWACRTAKLTVFNFLRRKRRSRLCFSDLLLEQLATRAAEATPDSELRREALRCCLEGLSGGDRRLVELCYDRDHNIKEAAEQLDRPVGAVYKSLGRVRRALHDCISRRLAREGDA